jgi:hypothetical protein
VQQLRVASRAFVFGVRQVRFLDTSLILRHGTALDMR